MNFDNILIVTYGRSGSTLLQGLLNSIDNVTIRGENFNFIYNLFYSYKSIESTSYHIKDTAKDLPTNPWYGATSIDLNQSKLDIKKLILNVLKKDIKKGEVVGFKEIRYLKLSNLEEYLDFILEVLPNTALIFNFRSTESTIKSGWWKDMDPKKTVPLIDGFKSKVLEYNSDKKENTFIINYEDLVDRTGNIEKLFNFLGASYDKDSVNKTLSTEHSYNNKSSAAKKKKTTLSLQPKISYSSTNLVKELVKKLNIDWVKDIGGSITISGVLVFLQDEFSVAHSVSLVLDDGSNMLAIQNIPSPYMFKQNPKLKHAKTCRFRLKNVSKSSQVLQLVLTNKSNKRIKLATIDFT